jgi:hypothetical protein
MTIALKRTKRVPLRERLRGLRQSENIEDLRSEGIAPPDSAGYNMGTPNIEQAILFNRYEDPTFVDPAQARIDLMIAQMAARRRKPLWMR